MERRFSDVADILKSDEYDAVHLVTPITVHAQQSVAVLRSGKHCACTIPMGLSIEELQAVIEAKRESGKNYIDGNSRLYS